MELTSEQILFIKQDLREKGITMDDLAENLLDHICCTIENGSETDFPNAYSEALTAFGNGGLKNIQIETILLINLKKEIIMRKTMYFLCYVSAFLISTGLLFKIQHWPGAAIILTVAIVLFNFGFLPVYFYDRYKRALN